MTEIVRPATDSQVSCMVLLNILREVIAKQVGAQDISAQVGMTADAIERIRSSGLEESPARNRASKIGGLRYMLIC
ncbi:hypothetical protein NKH55_03830 [Mesorhizobium opportunistum]|uniref:hypothetical protein n=1 Tax=Mesorhizobium opportunistum TaxID=593909 RepID=UPI00333D677C